MEKFYGTGVAMITPFKANGEIDFQALGNLIDYLLDGGVNYLVSLGTTGETVTLNEEERKAIWAFTANHVNGRVPLVAGIGGNNTLEVVSQIKKFDHKGYDAILSASPNYNKPTQEGIYQHYKLIAQNSPLPVILYNVPGRTGSNVNAETTVRLAREFKTIIGIKEASGNFDLLNQLFRDKPDDFLVISGDDPITLPMVAMGGVGIISVTGNALPAATTAMVNLCLKGDFKQAQPINFSLIEFTRLMFKEGNPAGVKAALKQLGVTGDTLRLPLVPVSKDTETLIAAELDKINNLSPTTIVSH